MAKTVWTFNRGEWTEAYVFLRLLGNGKVYGATSDLQKNPDVYVDIVNILRYDTEGLLKFERENNQTVSASLDGTDFKVICCSELNEKADYLYQIIKNIGAAKRISISGIQTYLEDLKFSQAKAPKMPVAVENRYGKKTDIIITAEDPVDHARITEGFSIKSHIGDPSTLFNSATNSGLIYKIIGCNEYYMHKLNSIESETGIFEYIKNTDLSLEFAGSKSEAFSDNLDYIDLRMIEFINAVVLVQIGYYPKARSQKSKDIIEMVAELNPLNVKHPDKWYAAKFKDFLYAAFSGLTAIQPWDGHRKMSGGYIDVSKDGEILYFRAMSDYIFSEYLYQNTFIDRPSRGVLKDVAQANAKAYLSCHTLSENEITAVIYKDGKRKPKKGDWGYVYENNGSYYIAINFQIRFK